MLKDIPVLLVGFNRPDLIRLSLLNLVNIGVKRLYVSLDGPRSSYDLPSCEECFSTVLEFSHAFDLQVIHRSYNLGCNLGVTAALDWFFSQEYFGIVIEDDCLVSKEGFEHFENFFLNWDEFMRHGVGIATAHNPFKSSVECKASQYTLINGWASSSSVWNLAKQNRFSLKLPSFFVKHLKSQSASEKIFWWANSTRARLGGVDTWDSIFQDQLMRNGVKTLIPKINSVKNIGFGPMATHTKNGAERFIVELPVVFHNEEINILLRDFYFNIRRKHFITPIFRVIWDLLRFTKRRNFEYELSQDRKNRKVWKSTL